MLSQYRQTHGRGILGGILGGDEVVQEAEVGDGVVL